MLTEDEKTLLGIWRRWPLDRERDHRLNAFQAMGLSETRALQLVNGLLSRREAWEYDPVTVARLRRVRDSRMRRAG